MVTTGWILVQRGGPSLELGPGPVHASVRQVLFALQRGLCAVCDAQTVLAADHDHETGLLRGLLCYPCNVAEGKAASQLTHRPASPRLLAYLANPPAACLAYRWATPDRRHLPLSDEQAGEALQAARLPPLPSQ